MENKMTPVEWLETRINEMIYNGGDLGEDLPALMQHIKRAKEMEKNPIDTKREEFFKRFDEAWDNKEMWGGEYGEGI